MMNKQGPSSHAVAIIVKRTLQVKQKAPPGPEKPPRFGRPAFCGQKLIFRATLQLYNHSSKILKLPLKC
jgi:hypothetical protein